MLTNSDATIYSRARNPSNGYDQWKRTYIKECWWFLDTKSSITEKGLQSANVLTVRIPNMSVEVKKGDYIIKGELTKDIQTVKDLATDEYYCVTTANYNEFGMVPHIKVVGS